MKQRLRQALFLREKQRIVDPSRISAAVLLPIYYKQGQYYILFIKRTEWVEKHKGEISFPGGVSEERDKTLLDTALRECAEEIDLMPDKVEILGELDDEVSVKTNYVITPFVALIPWPYQFKVDGRETEEIIEIPTSALLDKGYSRQETRDGETVTSYFYDYQGRVIWGATARILNKFLGVFAQAMESK
ncbi:MAG: CoA pyrophosphatase [Dehalococcoidia bacterium]|nr:MAG: CoA pyrophosphatase [Dehalococcoidia bacterium]